jgi:hypothetical protein
MIKLKRAYEAPARGDRTRFLVERLWPRGIRKSDLPLDGWLKDVAPSADKDDQGAKDHTMTRLRGLSSPAFDQPFLQHEAAFHKAVIDTVTSNLLPAIQNAELRTLVVQVAPAFEAHVIAAQNLEKKLAAR